MIHARSVLTANASTLTTPAKAVAAKSEMSRSAPISVGPTRRPPRRWSCGAAEKENDNAYSRRIYGHGAHRRRSRHRKHRIFPPLRRARLPSAGLRAMRPAALSADHRLPVVRLPRIELEKGRRQGDRAFLQRGAPRDSAGLSQKGEPTPDEALRVIGNLATPDGQLAPPDMVKRVGVGTRVRMVFSDVAPGLALPQWTIDETAPQPEKPWRYPQE